MTKFSRKEVSENGRLRVQRDAFHRQFGYDSAKAIRFVLTFARPLSGRVLEIGTGKGRFLIELAKAVSQVVTVDPNAEEQRMARLNATQARLGRKVRFVVADGADLPFADGSFDAAVSMNALHHMRDWRGVVDEMLRALRPGGKMVLADFDAAGFRMFDLIHRSEGRIHEQMPFRWCDIVSRLRRAGMTVQRGRGEHIEVLVGVKPAAT